MIHCGVSRIRNIVYKPLSLEEYTIGEKYCDEFYAFYDISVHVRCNAFLNNKFQSDLFIFIVFSLLYFLSLAFVCFFVIYNNKNYCSLPYILFIAVQNV